MLPGPTAIAIRDNRDMLGNITVHNVINSTTLQHGNQYKPILQVCRTEFSRSVLNHCVIILNN
jgi:hypothetical protein